MDIPVAVNSLRHTMKNVSILLVFLSVIQASATDINVVRRLYQVAPADEKQCRQLIHMLESYSEKNHPVFAGYKAAATMIMAKHVINPISKLSYFNKGKTLLEKALTANTSSVELHYLRYGIQVNAPFFLGYRSHISDDKMFLEQNISSADPELRQMIAAILR